jgi:S-DNA-T family DNA segregation ATPase FtsK/SpoIIIE
MIDSRTILDSPGANQLIGRGDMLISQGNDLIRVQCAFVDTPEVEKVNEYIGSQRGYASAFMLPAYSGAEGGGGESNEVDMSKKDPMFDEAARIVVLNQSGSTSLIQRRFSIGYNRAGRIIDQLEAAGIVGPFEGSKARAVLISDEAELERILNNYR